MLTTAQLQALRTELQTDPNAYGYAPLITIGNHVGLADMLNLRRAGIIIRRADIQPEEVFHAIATADLINNPSAPSVEYYGALLNATFPIRLINDDGSDTPVRANIIALFRVGTGSLTRLQALSTRDGSRAEQLFGRNTFITISDVGEALL